MQFYIIIDLKTKTNIERGRQQNGKGTAPLAQQPHTVLLLLT